jgi:hypothetical protein
MRSLSIENACSIYSSLKSSSNSELVSDYLGYCISFICIHSKSIVYTEAFLELSASQLMDLIQYDQFHAGGEIEIFNSVLRWAAHGSQSHDTESIKQLVEPIIQFIRFPLISANDFSTIVEPSGIINDDLIQSTTINSLPRTVRITQECTILNNVPLSQLIEDEWKIVYDYPYSHITSISELEGIRENYPNCMICVAAKSQKSPDCIVAAFDLVQNALTETFDMKQAANHNDSPVYWYMVDSKSFGFAEKSDIDLCTADMCDSDSVYRLSWHLTGSSGFRAANLNSLTHRSMNTQLRKLILIHTDCIPTSNIH